MPPKRAAKDAGKPAGRVTKTQKTSARKTNASLKEKVVAASAMAESDRDTNESMDVVQSTTEAAAPASVETQTTPDPTATLSSNAMPATPVSTRDKVIQTTELLENILRFAGYKTLLTSVLRVNKYFNTTATASPCLQKAMFESFSPSVSGQPDFANQFHFNAALADGFQFPGSTATLEAGTCCGESERPALCCEGHHFLRFVFVAGQGDLVTGDTSANSWRKLRLLMPTDDSRKSCKAQAIFVYDIGFPAGAVFSVIWTHLTLGQLWDWLEKMWEEVTEYSAVMLQRASVLKLPMGWSRIAVANCKT